MGTANSLLLIGENKETILNFRSKLMLLRDVDSITESSIDMAISNCRKYIPDAVIIFDQKKDERLFEICKTIRQDSILKNIPVIFVLNNFDDEFLLSAFDAGMSDYITLPSSDSNVLMRIIWSLQNSATSRELDKKNLLLADLKVLDKETGAYTPEYTDQVFSNEINSAQKYKNSLSLMAIAADKIYQEKINDSFLAETIRTALRTSDLLGSPESKIFFVILPKTDKNGVQTVFKRISSAVSENFTISAGACELEEGMTFEDISNKTLNALSQALEEANSLVIDEKPLINKPSDSWLDKVQDENKNYKLFKQAFAKKTQNVIKPTFIEAQNLFSQKYQENISVNSNITEKECSFFITDNTNQNQACFKITDAGFSKVVLDLFYIKNKIQSNKHSKTDLSNIDESYLLKILNNISKEFDTF